MPKTTLTESTFDQKMFDAVRNGDVAGLEALMNDDTEILDSSPEEEVPTESTPEPSGTTDPEPTETPVEETTPPETKPPVEEDWKSQLPEEVRALVDSKLSPLTAENLKLSQYYRSNEGRVAGLQKQIGNLNALIEDLKKQAEKPAAAPVQATVDDEDLALLKENDPVLYNVFRKERERYAQLKADFDNVTGNFDKKLQTAIQPIHEDAQYRYQQQEAQKVLEQVPDVEQIVRSDNWKIFKADARVPPGVKALAESDNADDFITGLWMYKQWEAAFSPQPLQQQPVAEAPQTVNANTQRVLEERQRKLTQTTPQGKVAPRQTPVFKDEETELEEMYQRIRESQGFKK